MDIEQQNLLIELVTTQKNIYQRMLEILLQQAEVLEGGDSRDLVPLAQQVNDLKEQSEKLQVQIDPLRKQWSEVRETISDENRSQLKELTEDVQKILGHVLETMNHLRNDVDQSQTEIMDRLKKMSRGQAAHRGYGTFGQVRKQKPRFMDRSE